MQIDLTREIPSVYGYVPPQPGLHVGYVEVVCMEGTGLRPRFALVPEGQADDTWPRVAIEQDNHTFFMRYSNSDYPVCQQSGQVYHGTRGGGVCRIRACYDMEQGEVMRWGVVESVSDSDSDFEPVRKRHRDDDEHVQDEHVQDKPVQDKPVQDEPVQTAHAEVLPSELRGRLLELYTGALKNLDEEIATMRDDHMKQMAREKDAHRAHLRTWLDAEMAKFKEWKGKRESTVHQYLAVQLEEFPAILEDEKQLVLQICEEQAEAEYEQHKIAVHKDLYESTRRKAYAELASKHARVEQAEITANEALKSAQSMMVRLQTQKEQLDRSCEKAHKRARELGEAESKQSGKEIIDAAQFESDRLIKQQMIELKVTQARCARADHDAAILLDRAAQAITWPPEFVSTMMQQPILRRMVMQLQATASENPFTHDRMQAWIAHDRKLTASGSNSAPASTSGTPNA
jgi:hypothetical protein